MASDTKLLNVVAFNAAGDAVIEPLKSWKVIYRQRQASIEIKCGAYAKTYDLRTQAIAVVIGGSSQKVALGKTLGRVALTGLLHGRHAAGADLRWGGVDRDEYQQVLVMMNDTTTASMEMDADEYDELIKLVPESSTGEQAEPRIEKLMTRIKAMVADGERVLDELATKSEALKTERASLTDKSENGESFDERHAARERITEIDQQLSELATVQRAALYGFAVIQASKQEKVKNDKPKPEPPIQKLQENKAVTPLEPAVTHTAAPAIAKKKTSFLGKLVKLVVWILGACAGCLFNLFLALLLGPVALFLLVLAIPLGGWLALKMLAALMRR